MSDQPFDLRVARLAEIQTHLRTNAILRLEFLAGLARLFREHGVDLEPEVLSGLTLTIEGVTPVYGADDDPSAPAVRPDRETAGDEGHPSRKDTAKNIPPRRMSGKALPPGRKK